MSSKPATALASDMLEPAAPASPALGFDEAFTLHHRAVYHTAYALLRDAGLAEDVAQETFLRLYRQGEAAPQGEHLRPWLLRVTINLAHNTNRARTRTGAREAEFFKQAGGEGALAPAIDADYERRNEIEAARAALAKIDEPMRSCLLLKQQGLSYREIAAALQVNENYVGSLIARGRKEFVRVYGKIGGRQ
ncbi:MAG TPA: sigma-70 family RNA polymerase sigma factor [Pyrinomonadaceae bacterium]|jgi:RNA polymerase sigma-70 factor (ECF subfamily)